MVIITLFLRTSFLNLMKLNASNCHLLPMNSISGFSRTLSKFYTIRYGLFEFQNTYFRKHLWVVAFIRFRSTCFSEQLNVDTLFIEQPSYFLLGIFSFKESPKKTRALILTSMMKGNSCFLHYFLRCHSSNTFLYWRNKKILISLKRHFQR